MHTIDSNTCSSGRTHKHTNTDRPINSPTDRLNYGQKATIYVGRIHEYAQCTHTHLGEHHKAQTHQIFLNNLSQLSIIIYFLFIQLD